MPAADSEAAGLDDQALLAAMDLDDSFVPVRTLAEGDGGTTELVVRREPRPGEPVLLVRKRMPAPLANESGARRGQGGAGGQGGRRFSAAARARAVPAARCARGGVRLCGGAHSARACAGAGAAGAGARGGPGAAVVPGACAAACGGRGTPGHRARKRGGGRGRRAPHRPGDCSHARGRRLARYHAPWHVGLCGAGAVWVCADRRKVGCFFAWPRVGIRAHGGGPAGRVVRLCGEGVSACAAGPASGDQKGNGLRAVRALPVRGRARARACRDACGHG